MKKLLLVLLIIFSGVMSVKASHLMGAEITYKHVSGDDYEVTLIIYRDCSGIDVGNTANVSFISNSCGLNFNETFDLDSTIEVSQLCDASLGSSTCNGGSLPGTQKWVYSGIVTMTGCTDWVISWEDGSRNPAITNLVNPDFENLYIEATLNNIIGTNNNSPQYLALPTPYLCANQLNIFNHGASDVDGDSLYYQFAQPLSAAGNPIAFAGGYSINDPIITSSGMNLNPETGEMCFTPTQAQICVVSVIVLEYRNDVLIGSQIREMQVVVDASCVNSAPTAGGAMASCGAAGALTVDYMGSSVTQIDANSFVMCPDDSLCFTIPFADIDGDNVSIIANLLEAIPTANYTITGNGTTNAELSFCWVPTPLDSGINIFTVQAQDDACPISGAQYYTYDITIFDQPYAGEDQIICGTQTADLQALGGGGYVWSVLSGDTDMSHLSCTNCDNTVVDPDMTTTYLLTSSLAAACENTDTVTVFVVPDFSADALGDTTLCDYLSKELGVTITSGPLGIYGFLWNNEATLDDNTLENPMATPTESTFYVVEITSPDGCVKREDSAYVQLVPPAELDIFPGDTTICDGEVLNFDVQSTCSYTLEMSDPGFGDGWNGQSLDIYEDGVLIGNYTLLSTDNNGDFLTVEFPVTNGSNIVVIYNTGSFQSESAFNLIDGLGTTVSTYAQGSMTGLNQGDTLYNSPSNCAGLITDFTFNWSPSSLLSDSLIANPVLTSLDSTQDFTVTITDTASGCAFDRGFSVEIFEGYNPIASPDTNLCAGQQVQFSVDGFTNTCDYTVSLYDSWGDGWNTTGAVDILVNGVIYLANQTVPDCSGSDCEEILTITVTSGDIITFDYTSGSFNSENTITLFDGDGGQVFTVNDPSDGLQTPTTVECSGGLSFSWSPANDLSDPTLPDPVFSGTSTSTYAVEIYNTDRPLCNGFDSITIVVNSLDMPMIFGDSVVCFGEPVTYTVSGADSIIWPDNSNDSTYTFTPQNDSLLTVIASTFCGNITWDKHIVVYPEIELTASPDTVICEGQAIPLNLDGILINECTYLLTLSDSGGDGWDGFEGVDITINGVLYEGGFSVESCSGAGCTNSIVIPINEGDVLTLEYTSGATDAENTIELFDAAGLSLLNVTSPTAGVIGTFNTTCSNAYDIAWSPSTQLSDATIANPIFTATTPESYEAVVFLNSNPACADTSNTISIDVRSIEVPVITGDSTVCLGGTVPLSINADSVLWWGDTLNVSTSFVFTPPYDSIVTATASTFCIQNAVVTHFVEVFPLPVVSTVNDTTITIQDEVTLTTTGGEIYYWSPGTDLSCIDCSDPVASPSETTEYYVMVTDSNGCVSGKYVNIEVVIPDLFIPNGFSPNGDGINDLVEIRSLSIVSMTMQIYDRWGALIFESNDQENSWDGTYNGSKQDAGVYVYKFEARMVDEELIEQSGTITLFR